MGVGCEKLLHYAHSDFWTNLSQTTCDQGFSDLNRIQSGPLTEVITHAPEQDGVRVAKVLANPTDKDFVSSVS